MLTYEKIMTLSGNHLDNAVGRIVLGWRVQPDSPCDFWTYDGKLKYPVRSIKDDEGKWWSGFHPSTDPQMARLVEEQVESLLLASEYVDSLRRVTISNVLQKTTDKHLEWLIENTSPTQRCRAALLTILENT